MKRHSNSGHLEKHNMGTNHHARSGTTKDENIRPLADNFM